MNFPRILLIIVLASLSNPGRADDSLGVLRWDFTDEWVPDPKGTGGEPHLSYREVGFAPKATACTFFIAYMAKRPGNHNFNADIAIDYEIRGQGSGILYTGIYSRRVSHDWDPMLRLYTHSISTLDEIFGSVQAKPAQGWRDEISLTPYDTLYETVRIVPRLHDTHEEIVTTDGKPIQIDVR